VEGFICEPAAIAGATEITRVRRLEELPHFVVAAGL
jgi:hypothetical protein